MNPLHDIFSSSPPKKESTCPNPNLPIIVDTREKQSLIAANLFEQKANLSFEKLEIGDYLIQETIVERKTFPDFLSSMQDRRLIAQLQDLKKYPKHFLLIEGFFYEYQDQRIHENAIRGMLLTIATEFQVPIIFTKNPSDTSKFLITLAKKYEKNSSKKSFARPGKSLQDPKKQKEFILQGFPGIGPTLSKNLFEEFGNLESIFNATKEDLLKIPKFDEKKVDSFLKLLGERH